MIGPIMIAVLVAFIATIIFEWGGGGFQNRPDDTIGVIAGQDISLQEFDRYYTQLLANQRRQSEEDLTQQQIEQLRSRAWAEIQADILMGKEIEKRHIFVTEQEIYDFLKLYPPQELQAAAQFTNDEGKFDYQKYINAMVNPDNAPFWASVEQYVLPDLKKMKLQEAVIGTARVTPAEVMRAYLDEKETVKIAYVNNVYRNYYQPDKLPSVTDEELQAYYEEHKEDYKRDKRANLDVVAFPLMPSESDWSRKKFEIDQLYDSLKAGSDFAELAQIFSEDNSAEQGGDLGWFGPGRMVPSFDSAAFSLKKGDFSAPVKTQFGWHLIQLKDTRTDKDGKEERNAAHILLKVEPSSETISQISTNAADFAAAARDEGFEAAAEEFNYEIKPTGEFLRDGYAGFLGRNQNAINFAFDNEVGSISDPFEDQAGYYVVKVKEHLPAGYTPFEDAKASIQGLVSREKARKIAQDSMAVAYQEITNGNAMKAVADKYGFAYDTTASINNKSIIRNVGNDPQVLATAFALENSGDISKPVEYDNGIIVMKLLDRISPNIEEFNQKQDSIYQAVLLKKRQDMYSRWYNQLVEDANIENNVDRFYQSSM